MARYEVTAPDGARYEVTAVPGNQLTQVCQLVLTAGEALKGG